MNKHFTSFLILLFVNLSGFSQELKSYAPQEPAAAELIKSIDYPISYNTGLPNINIPLHTVSVGNISMPIGLNYSSRGFEANTQEGVAGLGWSLSNDLQITRVVNGVDDFTYNDGGKYGYFHYNVGYKAIMLGCDGSSPNQDCEFRRKYRIDFKGDLDGRPDKFYYSLLSGRSGAFYFQNEKSNNPDGSGTYTYSREIVQFPYTGVKIQIVNTPQGVQNGDFIITDIDGTEYHYGSEIEINAIPSGESGLRRGDYITSWKCSKIVTANKQQKIELNYEDQVSTYTFSSEDKIKVHLNKNIAGYPAPVDAEEVLSYIDNSSYGNSNLTNYSYETIENSSYPLGNVSANLGLGDRLLMYPVHYTKHSSGTGSAYVFPTGEDDLIMRDDNIKSKISKREQKRLRLSEISFPNGKILYEYDLSGSEIGQLKEINIKDVDNKLVKEIHFYQSTLGIDPSLVSGYSSPYYDDTTSYMDSLSIQGAEDLTYKFMYNNAKSYKNYAKGTGTIYDGVNINNFSLIDPALSGPFTVGSGYLSYNTHYAIWGVGANYADFGRLSDDGMLEQIKYPTKGYTNFVYEQNEAYAYTYLAQNTELVEGFRIKSIYNFDSNNSLATKRDFVYGKDEDGGGIMRPLLRNDESTFYLENGLSLASSYYNATNNIYSNDPSNMMLSNSVETQNHYEYEIKKNNIFFGVDDISTAVNNGYTSNNTLSSSYTFSLVSTEKVKTLKKNTFASQSYSNPVYYDMVTEYTSSAGSNNSRENGKTVYKYRTVDDITQNNRAFGNYNNYSGVISENCTWAYGQLASKTEYKSKILPGYIMEYTPIRETINEYETNDCYSIYPFLDVGSIDFGKRSFANTTNVPIGYDNSVSSAFFNMVNGNTEFFTPQYQIGATEVTGYVTLENTKEIRYHDSGDVEKTITYTYDPETLLRTKIETGSSDLGMLKTENTYLKNITNPTSVQTSLLAQYRLSELIETKNYKNGVLLSNQKTNYKDWGPTTLSNQNLILPEVIQTAKGTNALKDRIQFVDYYDNGNVKEVSKEDGAPIVYIWGYNDQYPIAKIENATFTSGKPNTITGSQQTLITNAVSAATNETSTSTENTLRTKLQLLRDGFTGAMVATYTYDLLIGVTSSTDSRGQTIYYHYDDLNRLEFVKDQDGNILSKNEYHYKGQ